MKEGMVMKKMEALLSAISYKFAAKNPHACVWNESHSSLT